MFFVEKAPGVDMRGVMGQARAVCRGCLVREECAAWALEHDERGIWGGMTEQERRKDQRSASAASAAVSHSSDTFGNANNGPAA